MDLGLFQHIDHNRRRSAFLVVVAVLVLVVLGGVMGASLGHTPWAGMAVATVVGLVLALVAWNQGGSIVLGAAGAREVTADEDPELVNVVEEMAIASGLPRPRIYIMETGALNAFATGMKPDQGVVCVTRGLRETLTREELQGVVAHEMAHIGNYDSRLMVLMAVIVGSVAILSDMYLRGMMYSGNRRRSKGGNALAILAVILAILAPIFAVMIQFAVSRKREYLADATAAAMTRNPGALADALEKLSQSGIKLEKSNRGTQHLFIVNPLRLEQKASSAFATHPPIQERIRRLRKVAGTYGAPAAAQ